ncbi:MAG: RluA family pseudouridine synthase [Methylovirgula sp.]
MGLTDSAATAAETFAFAIDTEAAGRRLDAVLAARPEAQAAALSRTRLKGLIETGAVRIDGAPATDAGQKVKAGQAVAVTVPAAEEAVPKGEAIPLSIVHEDAHLIVIDKPAGLVVHPAPGHFTGTLVNALIAHCGDSLSGIGGVKRPGIVHRLDKDTSGLIVAAKTDAAHKRLAKLFADHSEAALTRTYLAFVWGVPDHPAGTIDLPLGRHKIDREKMAVVRGGDGREAVTHWEVVETYNGSDGKPVASLLRCRLETGRTHQIRVHLAHIGHPLLADPVYGRGFKTKATRLGPKAQAALEKLGRQALHAAELGFVHPVSLEEFLFESPLPADLAKLRKTLAAAA